MNVAPLLDNNIPIVAYSYSSRGFPDVIQKIQSTLPFVSSTYLLSLYDVCYLDDILHMISASDDRIRIWDSGGYEKRNSDDVSAIVSAIPNASEWNIQKYIETAINIPWNGKDILVSFDDNPQLSVNRQIQQALEAYNKIKGHYFRDVLLHVVPNCDVNNLVDEILPYMSEIDIVGFTEKEIAPTWKQGIKFVNAFKRAFQQRGLEVPPIHLFGCLDPKSLIYFTLAGVSIFDGLSWLRFYFHDRATLYRREFEFLGTFDSISGELDIDTALMLNNINAIDTLRSDLLYELGFGDSNKFATEKRILENIPASGGQ